MTPSLATQNTLTLIGRALLAALYIPAGYQQLMGFDRTVEYIASNGVPLPGMAAALSVVIHLGLGLTLLLGYKARWAALGFAVFTVVITFIFHRYWADPGFVNMEATTQQAMTQKYHFYKNLGIVGGLLAFVGFGPGGWSIDATRGKA